MSLNAGPGPSLSHPARKRIYEHLLRLPGDHFRSIVRALRLGLGATHYHLRVMVREGLVVRAAADGRSRYYPIGKEAPLERNLVYMMHWRYRALQLRVLNVLSRLREADPATVARELGISRQLAFYHLGRLAERGAVRRSGRRFVPQQGP